MVEATVLGAYPDLSAKAYEILRREVVTCRLSPGARLEVVQLARRLGVSRSPVTDALNKLSGEGLVEEVPRKGYFVASLDPAAYVELLEARLLVELAAVEKAIALVGADEVAEMRALIGRQQAYLDDEGGYADYQGWVDTDCEFHRVVVAVAGNRHITAFHGRLNTHAYMTRIFYSRNTGHRPSSATIVEHTAIADAYERRDLAALKAALTWHIRETAKFFATPDLAARMAPAAPRDPLRTDRPNSTSNQ